MKSPQPSIKPRSQSGFTLIELIMVIVILGILSAAAKPRFIDLTGHAKKAVSDFHYGTFQSAMKVAFARNRSKGITLAQDNGDFITDCATLLTYLEGDILPKDTTCVGGEVTFPDGEKASISAETETSRARLGDKAG